MTIAATGMTAEEMLDEARRARGKVYTLDWRAYQAFQEELGEQPLRLAYMDGQLELLLPHTFWQQRLQSIIRYLFSDWCVETRTSFQVGGGMTFESEQRQCAIQGDDCYWITNAPGPRNEGNLDRPENCPPDLYIEVVERPPVIDRAKVVAALKVPEMWRFDGNAFKAGILQAGGKYRWGERSKALPEFPVGELARFLQDAEEKMCSEVLREFRSWVRKRLGKKQD